MLPSPSIHTLLESLPSRARLIELARHFGVFVPQKGTRAELCATLARSEQVRMRSVVEWHADTGTCLINGMTESACSPTDAVHGHAHQHAAPRRQVP